MARRRRIRLPRAKFPEKAKYSVVEEIVEAEDEVTILEGPEVTARLTDNLSHAEVELVSLEDHAVTAAISSPFRRPRRLYALFDPSGNELPNEVKLEEEREIVEEGRVSTVTVREREYEVPTREPFYMAMYDGVSGMLAIMKCRVSSITEEAVYRKKETAVGFIPPHPLLSGREPISIKERFELEEVKEPRANITCTTLFKTKLEINDHEGLVNTASLLVKHMP